MLTAGAARAQGAEAARARLQRAPGPGGMWSQDTTAESRRQLVELLPLVRPPTPAPRADSTRVGRCGARDSAASVETRAAPRTARARRRACTEAAGGAHVLLDAPRR